ncbi:radical SAM protein [Streptomyces sp. FH025]|uniref:radical SAM protein n=1 Tax=Streptomyces sp. FH025 TaxID=2815937 RepID=UPI001A9EBB9F|nr:radical SAM protein [Streptomyces sp. FH025]MBO1413029.1 radical SAM protein [Streptomyces sp. FH025]
MTRTHVRSWEYRDGGVVSINDGETVVRVHPNVPYWAIAANMACGADLKSGPARIFALSVTDRCNIACDFCCHPYLDSALSEQDCVRMVQEACELPFDEICVTGGEPYTRRRLVYRLASICKERGRLFGSITNGFWARNRERAFLIAENMIEHGVARVTFSWDPSHGEFVAPQTVQNGIDACMRAGLRVCLTGSFKEDGDCHANYGIDVSAYEQYANFSLVAGHAEPAGRGKDLDLRLRTVSPDAAQNLICPGRGVQELVVYARDGLAQPCCSIYAGYDMPQLRIGDWRRQSVADLLDAQEGDAYFRVIADGGFRLLYEILAERAPDLAARLPDPRDALSACQLCESVMTGPDAATIRRICDEYLTERLNAVVLDNAQLLAALLPDVLAQPPEARTPA